MTKTIALISALALAAGLGAAGAQAAPTHKTTGELASKAQLSREHARAVKAGDTANDPANSASSDALNQQQLAKAQALPGADVQPGAINGGTTNTSGVDANAPAPDANNSMPNTNSMPSNNMPANNSMSNDNMATPPSPNAPSAPTPGAVPPPPPSDGPTPGTQITPQGNTTSPQ